MKKRKFWFKSFGWSVAIVFIFMNVLAMIHAYKFTHFTSEKVEKTKDPNSLSAAKKLDALVFGVNNPRPENNNTPTTPFETIRLKGKTETECWRINAENAKGIVILFHGYSAQKSSMLDKAEVFKALGYSTLLVDFMGSGGSEGNQTTIGYFEAEQVKTCFDYLSASGEKNIYLFGTSMGAAAIMKAMSDYNLNPSGIILECPFGSFYKTVCARFETMRVPTFPMAGLLVFWGSVENGFWAFGHNPTEYAENINCPTLLMYGAKDEKVSREEIDEIFESLKGQKSLAVYPNAAHENYLLNYGNEWTTDVANFLK